MTVTEFLLARIAEDEAVARGSGVIAWLTYRRPDGSMDHTEVASATVDAPDIWVSAEGDAVGFASAQVVYDERRVLAECEAKRRIVAEHFDGHRCDYGDWYGAGECETQVLRYLAAVHSDHADYLPEWKP